MLWISLSHSESKEHVTILLFLTSDSATAFWKGQVAQLLLFFVWEAILRIATVNDCADWEIEFQVQGTLEPGQARLRLEARFDLLGRATSLLWWCCWFQCFNHLCFGLFLRSCYDLFLLITLPFIYWLKYLNKLARPEKLSNQWWRITDQNKLTICPSA